jgi:hypothetical protein
VLARRFGLTFIDVNGKKFFFVVLKRKASFAALPRVIDILSNEFDWTPVRRQKEFNEAKNALMIEGIFVNKVTLPPAPPSEKKVEPKVVEPPKQAMIDPQASVVL